MAAGGDDDGVDLPPPPRLTRDSGRGGPHPGSTGPEIDPWNALADMENDARGHMGESFFVPLNPDSRPASIRHIVHSYKRYAKSYFEVRGLAVAFPSYADADTVTASQLQYWRRLVILLNEGVPDRGGAHQLFETYMGVMPELAADEPRREAGPPSAAIAQIVRTYGAYTALLAHRHLSGIALDEKIAILVATYKRAARPLLAVLEVREQDPATDSLRGQLTYWHNLYVAVVAF